jgi:hypothetical protein
LACLGVRRASQSGDLHRQGWILAYAGRAEEALDAAVRLGNKVLIAAARLTGIIGRRASDELRELFWEAAQQCHSYLMVNHAAMELGAAQLRAGAPLDGLLQLRSPARQRLGVSRGCAGRAPTRVMRPASEVGTRGRTRPPPPV